MKAFGAVIILSAFLLSSCATVSNQPVKVYFSSYPHDYALETTVVNLIDAAHSQVLVEAYGFTSDDITKALKKARKRIDINNCVLVIMDGSNETAQKSKIEELQNAHIKVRTDTEGGTFHNKIMIIDSMIIITGSFNFTDHANKNEENLLVITDHDIAMEYIDNWYEHKKGSRKAERK